MTRLSLLLAVLLTPTLSWAASQEVKVRDIARIAGVRDNPLTGYGLVFGLSGSGDSARNRATVQSVANTLRNFGVQVDLSDLSSRNVAAVLVTAKLPAFAEPGQQLDVQVRLVRRRAHGHVVRDDGDARFVIDAPLFVRQGDVVMGAEEIVAGALVQARRLAQIGGRV